MHIIFFFAECKHLDERIVFQESRKLAFDDEMIIKLGFFGITLSRV